MWTSPEYRHRHQAADHLVDIMHSFGLELATPVGTITFDNGHQMTIDLAMCSSDLIECLVSCITSNELAHDSDHNPTGVCFNISSQNKSMISLGVDGRPRTRRCLRIRLGADPW